MALKALMLRKKIDEAKKNLERAQATQAELEKREAELEASIAEAQTDEERATVEAAVAEYETDKAGNDAEVEKFETELRSLEEELTKEEAEKEQPAPEAPTEERKEKREMKTSNKFFGMSLEERTAFFENAEVKAFLQRTREAITEKRAISGGKLLIPRVVLELIREKAAENSKLLKHVNAQSVAGEARQAVEGTIPEAVWTEMCAKLNELDIAFNGVEVDGYKVGGFIPVCNALLKDNDIDLATKLVEALGKAIGKALDKAIVFGTGTKMPVGIFTRLAQTTDPSDPRTTIPWVDLHQTNIVTIAASVTGANLFAALAENAGIAEDSYSDGELVWVMNKKTKMALVAAAVNVNAAGALVATVNEEMPVVGGAIETLSFMPDNVIVAGYMDDYLLAEREGASIESSEHVKFIEDQTVFKGTARYDGLPVIAGAFVAIGIKGATPSASSITFPADSANP